MTDEAAAPGRNGESVMHEAGASAAITTSESVCSVDSGNSSSALELLTQTEGTAHNNSVDMQIDEIVKRERLNNAGLDRVAELALAVEFCKNQLRASDQNEESSDNRRLLMEKLIDCRLQMQRLKEEAEDAGKKAESERDVKFRGHEFVLQSARGRNPYCEVCMMTIWRIIQRWRRCKVCGLRSHEKCVSSTIRDCAGVIVSNSNFRPRTEFCIEKGLDAQNYTCAECSHPLRFGGPPDAEPRLCDYNGCYYCPRCHWNDEWLIPARVVHNWDCEKYKVCRSSKQLLSVIDKKPLFNIGQLNPHLLKFVTQLNRINKLRHNILLMKCYFVCCREARKLRILQYLNRRQHFVDNAEWYSLADLRDLAEGRLLPEIEQIVSIFSEHITRDCLICQGNGFICELCSNDAEVLYPFSEGVSACRDCCAVFHKKCYEVKGKRCPRCARRRQRAPPLLSPDESEA